MTNNAVAETTAGVSTTEAGLTKFDAPVLKAIGSTAMVSANGAAFVPSTMAEAMEIGKMMSLSNFVPKHLRGQAGDCLAVVLQSMRWGMDPFAVANKTYFVQDRMAYEAQLVSAVLNARAPLDGRLHVEWDGEGQQLTCKVTGKIKGDPQPHTIWQEISTIKTKNSPLWVSSPRQQLAYYTTRMWARLHCPEVLMGVYTEEEIREVGEVQRDGSVLIPPPRPTRAPAPADTREDARQGNYDMDSQFRATMAETPVVGHTAAQSGLTPPTAAAWVAEEPQFPTGHMAVNMATTAPVIAAPVSAAATPTTAPASVATEPDPDTIFRLITDSQGTTLTFPTVKDWEDAMVYRVENNKPAVVKKIYKANEQVIADVDAEYPDAAARVRKAFAEKPAS